MPGAGKALTSGAGLWGRNAILSVQIGGSYDSDRYAGCVLGIR